MVKVTVTNSVCEIEGLTAEMESKLREELKYTNQSVSYSYHQNLKQMRRIKEILNNSRLKGNVEGLQKEYRRLEIINRSNQNKLYTVLYQDRRFPTGLLPKVLKVLNFAEIQHEVKDLRVKPEKNKVKFVLRTPLPLLRYYQRTAARIVEEKGRGIVVAPTGTGKTLTVARMIWQLGVKTLVITPSKPITDNMVDTLSHYFGPGKVAKLSSKSGKTKDINVVNIQALVKIKPELLADIDAVFIDEFHHAAAETYQTVNMDHLKNCFYRIGVTATNFRNDGSDMALEAVLSEVLYEYTIEQALKDEFLVKPEFEIIDIETEDHRRYQTEYKHGIVENEERNDLVAQIVRHHAQDSVLVLVQQVAHGEELKAVIPGAVFIHGEEKDDVRQKIMDSYRKGEIKCLIGTSVIGEGVDLPIASVLVMAGGGKARSQVMQNVGRVLRPYAGKKKAVVYDFSDTGSNYLSKHSVLRQEVYKQYK